MHNGHLRLQWIASALLTWLPSLRRSLDTVGERSNILSEGVPFVSIRACLRTPSISARDGGGKIDFSPFDPMKLILAGELPRLLERTKPCSFG